MSITLKTAGLGAGPNTFSLGTLLGGIGQIATGNIGGGIGSVVQSFTGKPKPKTGGIYDLPGGIGDLAKKIAGGTASSGHCAPSGYHISKRTGKLVRNRHMNPLNPRAAMRAVRRLKSAHKAFRKIDRFAGPKHCSCHKTTSRRK